MQFSDLTTFLSRYTGTPSRADLEHFIPTGAVIANINKNMSVNEVDDWVSSGEAVIATEIAQKLISGKGYAILEVNDGHMDLHWLAGNKFVRMNDIKQFYEYILAKEYKSAFDQIQDTKDTDQTALMLKEDLADYTATTTSTWFDSDDDWSYTHWSQFFNEFDYNDSYDGNTEGINAWLIQIDDLEFSIMNWTITGLNVLLAYINTKV